MLISRTLYAALCIVLGASIVFFLESRAFNVDAIETIHSAWKISVGEVIYVDFDQPRNPGIYYLLAPIILFFGSNIDTFLIISYFMAFAAILTIYLSYKIAEHIFGNQTAKLAALILAALPWFAMAAFAVRADTIMLVFELLALLLLLRFLDSKRKIYLILSAIAISVAFVFIQKAAFFAIILGILMLNYYFSKKLSLKDIVIFIFSAIAVQLLFWLFLYFQGALSEYLFFNFTYVLERQNDLKIGNNRKDLLLEMLLNWQAFTPFILGLFGYFFVKNISNTKVKEIGFIGLLLLLTVLFVGRAYIQYYLPAMPFFAIIIAYGICQLQAKKQPQLILLSLILIGVVNNIYNGLTQHEERKQQLAKIDYVLKNTDEGDYVYDGGNYFNAFRKDLDFFWYGGVGNKTIHRVETYQKFYDYNYDIYSLIKTKRPQIISHYFIDNDSVDWLLWRYKRHEKFSDIYELIPNNTGFDFWTVFVDNLNIGSYITPQNALFNKAGDIEVTMFKANSGGKYNSYSGLSLRFNYNEQVIDLDSKNIVKLKYKASNKVAFILAQQGLKAGMEHQLILAATDGKFVTKQIKFSEFSQPQWVENKVGFDESKLTGFKFMPAAEAQKVQLNIREIKFEK